MSEMQDLQREDFRFGVDIPTRWADCDAYGHVNNIIYYSWFDTAVTRMLYQRGVLFENSPLIGLCVESKCSYFAPVSFPATVETKVRLGKIGGKSLVYEVGVFLDGVSKPAAAGYFVHVFVDRTTRKPAPLTEESKSVLQDLLAV